MYRKWRYRPITVLQKLWPNLRRDIVLNGILGSALIPTFLRWRLLRLYGLEVSKSRILPHVWFGNSNITIGEDTFINYRCVFNTHGGITIGARCDIAMDVHFITNTHEVGTPERRAGRSISHPIVIGDGVWIGARSMILPGVVIGDGAIVAAGSVVTSDCAPNTLYAGSPAQAKKNLSTSVDQ